MIGDTHNAINAFQVKLHSKRVDKIDKLHSEWVENIDKPHSKRVEKIDKPHSKRVERTSRTLIHYVLSIVELKSETLQSMLGRLSGKTCSRI